MHTTTPVPETVVRRWTEPGGIRFAAIMRDPADAEQTLYATATRADGTLVGSYYPADQIRQTGWHVVVGHGEPSPADSEPHAVRALTNAR